MATARVSVLQGKLVRWGMQVLCCLQGLYGKARSHSSSTNMEPGEQVPQRLRQTLTWANMVLRHPAPRGQFGPKLFSSPAHPAEPAEIKYHPQQTH